MSYKMEKCPILKDVLYFSKSCVRVLHQRKCEINNNLWSNLWQSDAMKDRVDIKAVIYTIIAKGASGFMKPGYPASRRQNTGI